MKKYINFALALVLAVAFILGGYAALTTRGVQAEAITNYNVVKTLDDGTDSNSTTTANSFTFYSDAESVESYGAARFQVTQDINGSGTATHTLQLASKPASGLCSNSATVWADAVERVLVQSAAVPASRYVASTTNTIAYIASTLAGSTTGVITMPYVSDTVYNYTAVAAVSAAGVVDELTTQMTLANDGTIARIFPLQGAYCARIKSTTATSETITTTVYMSPVDYYQ